MQSLHVKRQDLIEKVRANRDFHTSISMPGGFVGTPDFASPEQFAGVQINIRSDLRCSA